MDEIAPAPHRRSSGSPGAPPGHPRRARPVPDPQARAVRGPRRGGPRRSSSTTPTRSSRRSAWSSAATRTRCACCARPAPSVDGERVRFPRGMCRSIVQASAPRQFTQYARNPERNVEIGGMHTVFAPNYGSPFVRDLDNGRRYGTIEDFRNFVKLAYVSPHLHHSGGTVCEPVDVPVNKRHLDMVYSHIKLQRQAVHGLGHGAAAGARHRRDGPAHVRGGLPRGPHGHPQPDQRELAAGLGLDHARRRAGLCRGQPGDPAHAVHPGRRDGPGHRGRRLRPDPRRGARRDDVRAARPAGRAGRAGLVRELHVDAVRRARRSGRRSPRSCCTRWPSLARRLGVPFRSGGSLCASKIADAQAAYESAATLQPTVLAGVNFVLHAAGWLEGGLSVGYEKFIMDADQCGMMAVFAKGVDLSENGQAARRDPRQRAGHPLPGHRPHAGQLRERVLPQRDRRQQQLRAVAGGRLPRRGPARQRHLEAAAAPSTRRRRWTPAIDEALLDFIARTQGVHAGLGGLMAVLSRKRGLDAPARAALARRPRGPDLRAAAAQEPARPDPVPAGRRPRVRDGVAGQGHRCDARLGRAPPGRRLPRDPAPVGPDDPGPGEAGRAAGRAPARPA